MINWIRNLLEPEVKNHGNPFLKADADEVARLVVAQFHAADLGIEQQETLNGDKGN